MSRTREKAARVLLCTTTDSHSGRRTSPLADSRCVRSFKRLLPSLTKLAATLITDRSHRYALLVDHPRPHTCLRQSSTRPWPSSRACPRTARSSPRRTSSSSSTSTTSRRRSVTSTRRVLACSTLSARRSGMRGSPSRAPRRTLPWPNTSSSSPRF